MTDRVIRVVLVDDHSVVREGYRRLLERTTDIVVVGEFSTGEDAYMSVPSLLPDVVIMDINLPGMSGLEALRRLTLKIPDQKVLMFSMHEDVVFASRSMQTGAKGYVTKSSAPQVMVEAVNMIANGKLYISEAMAQELASQLSSQSKSKIESLSAREFEVFRLLVGGYTVNEVSNLLHLSYKTVANYQSGIKAKLEVSNAAQVVKLGLDHGFIFSPDESETRD